MQDLVISGTLLEKIKLSPLELLIEMAVHLYDQEKLSMGQAKKMANLTQIEFQKEMAKRDVYIKYDEDDLATDLKNLELL